MSWRRFEIAWSCNADKSAHDRALYMRTSEDGACLVIGARYKNAQPSSSYEMELDGEDLRALSRLLRFLADQGKDEP